MTATLSAVHVLIENCLRQRRVRAIVHNHNLQANVVHKISALSTEVITQLTLPTKMIPHPSFPKTCSCK
eukprot:4724535-Amphidinium_carterae.1